MPHFIIYNTEDGAVIHEVKKSLVEILEYCGICEPDFVTLEELRGSSRTEDWTE